MSDASLREQLAAYKTRIDADIIAYTSHARGAVQSQYGDAAAKVTGAYLDLVVANGKRLPGALAMVGYEMIGGQDRTMIVRAAAAMEMLHAYVLVIRDIQNQSLLRRGKPTVHAALAASDLVGGNEHMGFSLALNAALSGGHAAQMLLAGLSVEPELIRKVLGIVSHTMIVTSHGQTYDLLYALSDARPTTADLEKVLHWKTAEHTFLNPLCVGMVLAEAGCEDTDAIREYALHAGAAYQIANDIAGVFGDRKQQSKDVREDLREGKRTYLTVYALDHASEQDKAFLEAQLGNEAMTYAAFERCRTILTEAGARTHAEAARDAHITAALRALDRVTRPSWNPDSVRFLKGLAEALR